jgi:F0F1-type ATP synthase assembly protein I
MSKRKELKKEYLKKLEESRGKEFVCKKIRLHKGADNMVRLSTGQYVTAVMCGVVIGLSLGYLIFG